MKARNLIGRLPERLVVGLCGLLGSIAFAGAPKFIAWWLLLWAPLFD